LHEKSFIDDATRILRALRYEQRLNFTLEPGTAKLLSRDVSLLQTISGDRLRHELELILKEDRPELVLRRASELGVLQELHSSLRGNHWLTTKFNQAREEISQSSLTIYLCLLIYPLTLEECEALLSHRNFPQKPSRAMRDTLKLKAKLTDLPKSLSSSEVYELLSQYVPSAIQANALASDNQDISQCLKLFLTNLRYVKLRLTGKDLKEMGISQGPQLGGILKLLLKAKLDGEVRTKREEENFVRRWHRSSFC